MLTVWGILSAGFCWNWLTSRDHWQPLARVQQESLTLSFHCNEKYKEYSHMYTYNISATITLYHNLANMQIMYILRWKLWFSFDISVFHRQQEIRDKNCKHGKLKTCSQAILKQRQSADRQWWYLRRTLQTDRHVIQRLTSLVRLSALRCDSIGTFSALVCRAASTSINYQWHSYLGTTKFRSHT